MKHHPQQLDSEIYLGETTQDFFNSSQWQTKRFGTSDGALRPWFVSRKEVKDMTKESSEHYDTYEAEIFKKMLQLGTSQF